MDFQNSSNSAEIVSIFLKQLFSLINFIEKTAIEKCGMRHFSTLQVLPKIVALDISKALACQPSLACSSASQTQVL